MSLAAIIFVATFMFAPLVAVSVYLAAPTLPATEGAAEATVGVGVILRAIARRLFRAGARNVMRITFGTMSRAAARAATSRLIRVFVRSLAGNTAKELLAEETEAAPDSLPATSQKFSATILAVIVGVAATSLSFYGTLFFADPETVAALDQAMGLSLFEMLLAAVVPLACLGLFCRVAGRLCGTASVLTTGIDGMMIQSYFTVSGSFLPMTTDFEFRGTQQNCARASLLTLSAMLMVFAALRTFGVGSDSDFAVFLASMFLTYAFVYSFPVRPLLGFSIWQQNKLAWVGVFTPILLGFLFAFPGVIAALL